MKGCMAQASCVGSARRQSQPPSVEVEVEVDADDSPAAAEGATAAAAADELPVQPQMMLITPRSRLSPDRAEKTGTERSSEALRVEEGLERQGPCVTLAARENERGGNALADAERTALGRPGLDREAVGEVGDEELGAAVAARRRRRALRRAEPLRVGESGECDSGLRAERGREREAHHGVREGDDVVRLVGRDAARAVVLTCRPPTSSVPYSSPRARERYRRRWRRTGLEVGALALERLERLRLRRLVHVGDGERAHDGSSAGDAVSVPRRSGGRGRR